MFEQLFMKSRRTLASDSKSCLLHRLDLILCITKSTVPHCQFCHQKLFNSNFNVCSSCGLSYVGRADPANPVYLSFGCQNVRIRLLVHYETTRFTFRTKELQFTKQCTHWELLINTSVLIVISLSLSTGATLILNNTMLLLLLTRNFIHRKTATISFSCDFFVQLRSQIRLWQHHALQRIHCRSEHCDPYYESKNKPGG